MAAADGFLWVVGSHGLKRKNAKPDKDHAENAKRLAKVALDGNRRLLACLPIELDARGEPCLVRQAQDGRRALRLEGDSQTNLLTRALADDPHFGPYMAIPGKDNGLDIEGLAVDGHRLLLGLRGPVLRGWSALLEIAVEAHGDHLRLVPLEDSGTLRAAIFPKRPFAATLASCAVEVIEGRALAESQRCTKPASSAPRTVPRTSPPRCRRRARPCEPELPLRRILARPVAGRGSAP